MKPANPADRFAALVEQFFLLRLRQQRNASPRTIAAYRDTFRLLLEFGAKYRSKLPETFTLADLNAEFVLAFLDHLEAHRRNTIQSRNARLAAIRSFLHFAALQDPLALGSIQRVLAIPLKRCDRPLLGYLTRDEIQAILSAPDAGTWAGRRDRVMLATMYNTGARVSEIAGMTGGDFTCTDTAAIRIRGKGRKERIVPLWRTTAQLIRAWSAEISATPESPLFPGRAGSPLTRSAITERLKRTIQRAIPACPELAKRRISPHTIRHSTAMHLLQAGIDVTVIALWLGHENPSTTHIYVEADMNMKMAALNAVKPPEVKEVRYRPPGRLLAFLQKL
jgi:integrase/recombinase XerD